MFLPLDKKPDWRNPPLVTLILVLINVLIFYTWQFGDERYEQEAFDYYIHSGLIQSELRAYLRDKGQTDRLSKQDIERGSHTAMTVFDEMRRDHDFQQRLELDQIIKPQDPGHTEWRSKHDRFTRLKQRIVSENYGLNPSTPSVTTLITNMFLHGNDGHLFGNMVMLLLLGFGVEIILGRLLFFIGYAFSGIAAGLAYVVLYSGDTITTVGASGAISGILGMSIMIYGMRKINFFYFLFVYFDYVKARAIWILPLYILSQLIIEFAFDSNINVAAHLGGFFAGLGFVGLLKVLPNVLKNDQIEASQKAADYQQAMTNIQQLMATMKIDEAREQLLTLQETYPHDLAITQLLFSIAKYNPASETYHQLAHKLLTLAGNDAATVKIVHDTFIDYANKAKPKPKWTPELMISLATRFAANGYLDEAEKLVNYLVNTIQDFPRNAEGLFALAKHFHGKDKRKAQHYRDRLKLMFPESMEARHLGQLPSESMP